MVAAINGSWSVDEGICRPPKDRLVGRTFEGDDVEGRVEEGTLVGEILFFVEH